MSKFVRIDLNKDDVQKAEGTGKKIKINLSKEIEQRSAGKVQLRKLKLLQGWSIREDVRQYLKDPSSITRTGKFWERNDFEKERLKRGLPVRDKDFDFDTIVLLHGRDEMVYFGHPNSKKQEVHLHKDILEQDNKPEETDIDLDALKASRDVNKLTIAGNIYQAKSRQQHYGHSSRAYIELVEISDPNNPIPILEYSISDDPRRDKMSAITFSQLYIEGGEWQFSPIGQFHHGTVTSIQEHYFKNKSLPDEVE